MENPGAGLILRNVISIRVSIDGTSYILPLLMLLQEVLTYVIVMGLHKICFTLLRKVLGKMRDRSIEINWGKHTLSSKPQKPIRFLSHHPEWKTPLTLTNFFFFTLGVSSPLFALFFFFTCFLLALPFSLAESQSLDFFLLSENNFLDSNIANLAWDGLRPRFDLYWSSPAESGAGDWGPDSFVIIPFKIIWTTIFKYLK